MTLAFGNATSIRPRRILPQNVSATLVRLAHWHIRFPFKTNLIPAIDLEAEIEVDVSGISSVYGPNAPKQRVAGSDEVFTVVNVEVRMTLGSDEGTIRVTAMANGTRCGLVSIRYSQGGPLDNDNDDEEPEDEDDSS